MTTTGEVLHALAERGIEAHDERGVAVIPVAVGAVRVSDYNGDAIGDVVGFYVCRTDQRGHPCNPDGSTPDDAGFDDGYVYASNVDADDFVDGADLPEMLAAVYAEVDPLRAAFFDALRVSVEEVDPDLIAAALSSLITAVGNSDPARFIDR